MWFNTKVKCLLKQKKRCWTKYCFNKSQANFLKYKLVRNKTNSALRLSRKKLENRIASEIKTNQKSFWRYIKHKTKTKVPLTSLNTKSGSKITGAQDIANCLNDYFSGIFTPDNVDRALPNIEQFQPQLNNIMISDQIVLKHLKKIKIDKSTGPDDMIPRVLFELKEHIAEPLSNIFKSSLSEGQLPQDWRDAIVVPIYKKGSKSDPGNYRPVSLTSNVCKIIESIIRDEILQHLKTYDLISEHQYGFVPGRSCTLQLLEVINLWTKALDNKGSIDVIYTDLRKAFDLVPHKCLIHKLPSFGLGPVVSNWISSFLTERRQKVRVGSEFSSWTSVTSGVPQGSVLGPILFIIYINDLIQVLKNSNIRLFADDAKIFKVISSQDDAINLQCDIDKVVNWTKIWKLEFNVSKCKVLHLGVSNNEYNYKMEHLNEITLLQSATEEKDLGVIFDNKLQFDQHIGSIVRKSNIVLGLIKRNFKYMNEDIFVKLYKTLVRPLVEYASPVWNPKKIKNVKLLEGIQRRATKLIAQVKDLPYPLRLQKLNLTTLEYRRKRNDIIEVFKIFEGYNDVNYKKFFDQPVASITRGHKYKITKNRCNTNIRQNFFTNRIIKTWNNLPENIINSESIETFKTRLERFWANLSIRYTPSFM